MKKGVKIGIFAGVGVFVVAAIVVVLLIVKQKSANKINFDDFRFVEVNDFDGEVTLTRDEREEQVYEGMRLITKDTVETAEDSEVELLVDDDKHIVARENTKFKIAAKGSSRKGSVEIKMLYGDGLFTIDEKLKSNDSFEVETPNATMSVRGTKFRVVYSKKKNATYVEVFNGIVWAKSDFGTFVLEEGDTATIYENDYESSVYPVWMEEDNGDDESPEPDDEVTVADDETMGTDTNGAQWKDIYREIVGDTKNFLSEKASFSKKSNGYSYTLLDVYDPVNYTTTPDGVPELFIYAYTDDSYNGRYNPVFVVTINPENNVAYVPGQSVIEITNEYLVVDGRPATFTTLDNNGNWQVKAIDIFEGEINWGETIASGGAGTYSEYEDNLGTSNYTVGQISHEEGILETIQNY